MKQKILLIIGAILPYIPSVALILFNDLHIDKDSDVYIFITTNSLASIIGLLFLYFGFKETKSRIVRTLFILFYAIGVIIALMLTTVAWNITIDGIDTLL